MNPALIVDDSLTVRMDLKNAFEAAGVPTRLCSTLAEARQALGQTKHALLVLDVLLPDGDGVELLAEVRRSDETAEMPILVLSSEAEVRDRLRGLKTGADEYVGKPYDRANVVARAKALLKRQAPTDGTSGPSRILLIDDSATFREALRETLLGAGYEVVVATTGEEGLRAAAEHAPSAIVVDGVLPGMDGTAVIRAVRLDATLRSLPCVLLTGTEEQAAELRALDAGADAFVRKEEDVDVMLAKLAAVLRRSTAKALAPQPSSQLSPKRILAVDDSATYLHALGDALRGDGYDVALARSGEEALEILALEQVDCILLDLMMPGLSGQETCRRIKAAPIVRNVPLIMLTALDDRDAMIQGLGAGADDYVFKSSEFESLKARVRAQIRRKQFEDENRSIREELLRKDLEAREAVAARDFAQARASLAEELERANRELESFSYSVSHDLRAPLRAMDGFAQALVAEYTDKLDETGHRYLRRISENARRMGEIIDDLLGLAHVTRTSMQCADVDLTLLAGQVLERLRERAPERRVDVTIEPRVTAYGDRGLLAVVLENLLGNAWKFTSKRDVAEIAFGRMHDETGAFFVRDNGAGFDMTYASKLFGAFQRLHRASDFEGTGIGLATVLRVVERHGGRAWAEGTVGAGATFYFTLRARSKPERVLSPSESATER